MARPSATPATITGKVTKIKSRRGSYATATIKGNFYTVCFTDQRRMPEVGETITIIGVERDGRFLTESWKPAEVTSV